MFGGDFTALGQAIYDPDTYSAQTGVRQAFPGNVILTNRINSISTGDRDDERPATAPVSFTQYLPYVSDTWKVTRGLTINYGLTWFLATIPDPQKWARDYVHSFDFSTGMLTYATLGQVDTQILSFDAKDLAPRLGVAWSPSFLKNPVIRLARVSTTPIAR
jgi:hypothetical protein